MSEEVKIPLPRSLQDIVGSLLFASETPLTATDLREAVRAVEPEEGENREVMDVYKSCTSKEIAEALRGLEKALDVAGCGFQLVCSGGAYRLQTAPSCGRYVRAMLKLDRPNRLGRASLETLAIIAYRQPLTKSEIEEIRGVDVSGNMKTLMDLQLIRLVGKSELPGHPFLYGTTPVFLEHFGLASLQQLNELDPTLQRSNPKLKAASYRKKVEPAPETPPDEAAPAAEPEKPAEPEAPPQEADAPADAAEETPAEGEEEVKFSFEAEADDEPLADDDDEPLTDDDDEDDDDDDEEGEDEMEASNETADKDDLLGGRASGDGGLDLV